MSDIVERLEAVERFGGTHLDGLWSDAREEIKRLRAENEMVKSQNRRLREAMQGVKEWHEQGWWKMVGYAAQEESKK